MARLRVRKTAMAILIADLVIGGSLLLFSGWWLQEVRLPVKCVGFSWLILCISTGLVRRVPYLQLASAWLWLGTSTWAWWLFDERALDWFLYQNMLPLIALACSHIYLILSGPWRRMAGRTAVPVASKEAD